MDLEINPQHPILARLEATRQTDAALAAQVAESAEKEKIAAQEAKHSADVAQEKQQAAEAAVRTIKRENVISLVARHALCRLPSIRRAASKV